MDIYSGHAGDPIKLLACHNQGGNQIFGLSKTQQIFTAQQFCVGVNKQSVVTVNCMDQESQKWKFDNEVCSVTK